MKKNYYLLLLLILSFWSKGFAQSPGCPNVVISEVDPICNEGDCVTLSAGFLRTGETTQYAVSPIEYAPPFPFVGGSYISLEGDDDWSDIINLGFDFCFFGNSYNKALITDNGALTFSIAGYGGLYVPGDQSAGYQFDRPIPYLGSTTSSRPPYASSIMGVLQDTYAAASASGPGKSINYQIMGTYPCRTLVFNMYEIGQWSCHTRVGTQTSQMVIYEGTNVIEVYVHKRTPCTTHNSGSGVIGIQNETGTVGYAPPGRNTGTWSAFDEAWRFTPSGAKNYDLQWFIDGVAVPSDTTEDGTPLETLTVCPTKTILVSAQVIYNQCTAAPIVVTDQKRVEYSEPPILGTPRNLKECPNALGTATFDLTQVNVDVTTDLLYQFSYFESEDDALENINALPHSYELHIDNSPKTIYVKVTNMLTDCSYIKNFQVIVDNCRLKLNYLPDLHICKGEVNSFNLNQYDTVVYNNNLGYSVSYHYSEISAVEGTNPIPSSVSLNYEATSGETIWVRVQDNNNPAIFGVTSFRIYIFDKPEIIDLTPLFACEITGTGLGVFNFSSVELEASGLRSNLEVTFYGTLAEAEIGNLSDRLPIEYTGYQSEIFVRVYNPLTTCYSIMPLVLNVVDAPGANEIDPLTYCSINNSGYGIFNLEPTKILIAGNPVPNGIEVTYHETLLDANNKANAIANLESYSNIVVNTQTLYVRVGYKNSKCATIVPLKLIVNSTPEIISPSPLTVCDIDNNSIAIFDLTTKVEETLNGLDPLDYEVSFYLSEANAELGTYAIENPSSFSNLTAEFVYIRVEDLKTGCFRVVALKLVATPVAMVTNPLPTYELCDDNFDGFQIFDLGSKVPSILGEQTGILVTFHYTQNDANSGSNALPSLYQNVSPNVQTIFVRLETVSTGCYTTTQMDLRVSPQPVLTIPSEPFQVCNTSQSGYGAIDLISFNSQLLGGGPEYILTYFETKANAENNRFPIANPNQYNNIHSENVSVWVRVVNPETLCFSVYEVFFKLVVAPRLPLSLPEIVECDVQGNLYDFRTTVDLTVNETLILNAQTIPGTYEILYFTSEALANSGTNWIGNAEAYMTSFSEQTFWVRVQNKLHPTICFSIMSFNVKVNVPLRLGNAAPIVVCDSGLPNDETYTFDLTSRANQITQGEVFGTSLKYFLTEEEAKVEFNPILNPEAFTNQTNPQTVWVSVTNMYGCKALTTITVRVLPLPEPNLTPEPIQMCEVELGDRRAQFDLFTSVPDISNGDARLNYTFYFSEEEALLEENAIDTPDDFLSESTTVYVRVTNSPILNSEQCFVIVPLELIVNPLPQIGPMTRLLACEEDTDGVFTFDLRDKNQEALAGQNPNDFTVTYYLTEEGANQGLLPLSYTHTSESYRIIFVRVENNDTGCFSIATLELIVEEKVFAYPPIASLVFCDTDGVNDGFGPADISSLSEGIISQQALTGDLIVRYYSSWANYYAGNVSPTDSFPITNNPQIVIAEVYNRDPLLYCTATVEFYITMTKAPSFEPIANGYVCPDLRTGDVRGYLMDTGLDISEYSFTWFRNGVVLPSNDSFYEATSPGEYEVIVNSNANGCSFSQSILVSIAPAFSIDQVNITDGFADTNGIEVLAVSASGAHLEYALNEGAYQDSNIFLDVAPGTHTVWVKIKGLDVCAISKVITVLNYPKFFTPNNDGYNDTWNIWALKEQPESKIYIFDRQGKLLKQLSPNGEGWDGTFNGQPLPSTDYWFRAEFIEPNTGLQKEAKGHFSLKR